MKYKHDYRFIDLNGNILNSYSLEENGFELEELKVLKIEEEYFKRKDGFIIMLNVYIDLQIGD